MTASYNLMILLALMLAFWINYGVSLWSIPGVRRVTRNGVSQWAFRSFQGGCCV